MILHVWTILCSNSVIDIESNNVSIQNVYEQLTLKGDPKPDGKASLPMELVSLWTREDLETPTSGEARISYLQPSGKESELITYPIDLEEYHRARSRVHIGAIPVPEPGRYKFYIEYRLSGSVVWQQVAQIPLEVTFRPEKED